MKSAFIFVCVFFTVFIVFATLVMFRASQGYMDTCIYKFEDCIIGKGKIEHKRGVLNTLVCSNKTFVCNARTLYQSFFDMDALDKSYNDYMQGILIEEMRRENKENENNTDDLEEVIVEEDNPKSE